MQSNILLKTMDPLSTLLKAPLVEALLKVILETLSKVSGVRSTHVMPYGLNYLLFSNGLC